MGFYCNLIAITVHAVLLTIFCQISVSPVLFTGNTKRGMSYGKLDWIDIVKQWEKIFEEYNQPAPDGLLRTMGVCKGLYDLIDKKFPEFEFKYIIKKFAKSRTCWRMRFLARKLAADKAETLRARRKKLAYEYSSKSTSAKRVQKSIFAYFLF